MKIFYYPRMYYAAYCVKPWLVRKAKGFYVGVIIRCGLKGLNIQL